MVSSILEVESGSEGSCLMLVEEGSINGFGAGSANESRLFQS